MLKHLVVATLFWILLISCNGGPAGPGNPLPSGGTETGNAGQTQIIFAAYSSSEFAPTVAMLFQAQLLQSSDGEITDARMSVQKMEFSADENCPSLQTPAASFVVDLLKMTSSDTSEFEDGPAEAKGGENPFPNCHPDMTVTFGPLESDSPAASTSFGQNMVGQSLLVRLEGVRPFPIEFRSTSPWTTTFSDPARWVDPSAGERLIFGFDVDTWFTGINLNDPSYPIETKNDETVLVVDSSRFPDVLQRLIKNKNSSFGLFIDKNGNQELDRDEYLDPISVVR